MDLSLVHLNQAEELALAILFTQADSESQYLDQKLNREWYC